MKMDPVYLFLDPYFIWFYRLTGHVTLNFLLGTFVLAWLSLLVGEATSNLAAFLVRRHVGGMNAEARKYQDLSMEALKAGNRPAYEASNKLANEAFGKSFFMQVALSATFFWPIFFILGWMQVRFMEVEFPLPLVGLRLGYIGAFVPLYVAAYFLYKAVKKRVILGSGAKASEGQGGSASEVKKPELSSASVPPT